MNADITVVYVLGTARSGSTLLTRLIAQRNRERIFAAGEIRLLWRELEHRTCGCGEPATDCPVWTEVVGPPGTRTQRARRITELMSRAGRMQDLPGILRARGRFQALPDETRRYAGHLGETYRRISAATGATAIVDSSKSVADAALLSFLPGIRPVLVHIIRDPRAVAYSWDRAVRSGARGTPDRAAWSVALRWTLTNAASEAVTRQRPDASYRLRYEDLVLSPEPHLAAIDRLIGGVAGQPGGEEPPDGVPDGARHIVGGNRLRAVDGPIRVRGDDAWRGRMSHVATSGIAGLTYPLLRRYSYAWKVGT